MTAKSLIEAYLPRCPPRLRLAQLPTPVERHPGFDVGGAEVWVKRDDQSSAVYAGSKVRKLEWALAELPADRPVLSLGGVGSHHLLALALFTRSLGRPPLHAICFAQPITSHVQQTLGALVSTGARLWYAPARPLLPWAFLSYGLWDRPPTRGRWMAAGASTPAGCLGMVEGGLELAAQIAAGELPAPKHIFVAAGTTGNAVGLTLGLALAGVPATIHLISTVEGLLLNGATVGNLMRGVVGKMEAQGWTGRGGKSIKAWLQSRGVTYRIDHTQVGDGYGHPTPQASAVVREAREMGIQLETTYTGKCLSGMRATLAEQHIEGPVLFWNTHAGTDVGQYVVPGWEERLPRAVRALLPTPALTGG